MDTSRPMPEPDRVTARRSDIEMILVVVAAGLALTVTAVGTHRYNPAPLDVEAGWFFSP